jgi:hypothetical protein
MARFLRGSASILFACLALLRASSVFACGGTFCDSPPPGKPPMPVDQSGENILFVFAEGHVEAHIQIQYTGDPARFAWLVPVPKVPEISVGSERLFANLLNATVPTFALQSAFKSCGGRTVTTPGCGFGGASDSSASFDGVGRDAGSSEQSTPPVVTSHEAVGAFDITVLSPKTADEVTSWLVANSFLQAPEAPQILQSYIDSGHVFAAVKLLPGAGVNEIHPLVIRYEGTAPCIPLKLTSVAATTDMGVRAFFLGERRVVPTTYREVILDPAELDWLGLGQNYDTAVSGAVDEPGADGHAFVTEYAGSSNSVDRTGIYAPAWDAEPFRNADPVHVMDLLEEQGLVTCSVLGCTATESVLLPIVRKFLPAPPGVRESDFYGCLSCSADEVDRKAWDGDAFADELDERVIQPGKHASELLAASPYVTRLFTRISPEEMTDDPEFTTLPGNSASVSPALSATQTSACSGDLSLTVPGLPTIALDGSAVPRFVKGLPFALSVAEYDPAGTRTVLFDNARDVEKKIASWNASQGFPHPDPVPDQGGACDLGGNAVSPTGVIGATLLLSVLRRLRRKTRPS